MSLTERRDEVRKALAEVESRGEIEGRTALFFGGAPVIGSRGVDADFAAEALGKYQDLITKVWAFKEHGSLAPSGPVPDRHEARPHVTNVVHGWFGFELAELQGPHTLRSSPLHEAINVVTRALIAAGKGDDDLADRRESNRGARGTVPRRVLGRPPRGASVRVPSVGRNHPSRQGRRRSDRGRPAQDER